MYWFLGLKFSEDIYVDVYDWVNNKKKNYYLISFFEIYIVYMFCIFFYIKWFYFWDYLFVCLNILVFIIV